jgi:hypothetical protein
MDTNAALYAHDLYAWTQTTAALLRAGTWDALDRAALAEEIESVGKRERRELGSLLQTLLSHLLQWGYQPAERVGSWRPPIRTARREIAAVLADSPSLRDQVPGMLLAGYTEARLDVSDATGLPLSTFPETCPWTPEQVLEAAFWPEGEITLPRRMGFTA